MSTYQKQRPIPYGIGQRPVPSGAGQRGAAAIFIVIFASLLISVITLGFVRLIGDDQQQALNSDLSQSAYDSAEAGIEDAKRALADYAKFNCFSGPTSPTCSQYDAAFASDCGALFGVSNLLGLERANTTNEVQVSRGSASNDRDLRQSYTCANIKVDTPTYSNTLVQNSSDLVPIRATGPLTSINLSWFTNADAGSPPGSPFTLRNGTTNPESWTNTSPPIMRVQYIHFENGDNRKEIIDNSKTLFLYPQRTGVPPPTDFGADRFLDPSTKTPRRVLCNTTGQFACTVSLNIPSSLRSGDNFLRITPLYNKASFQVMLNGTTFDGVAPIVDVTGRAGDLFRRIESQVTFGNAYPYPEAVLEASDGICKSFSVGAPGDFERGDCDLPALSPTP